MNQECSQMFPMCYAQTPWVRFQRGSDYLYNMSVLVVYYIGYNLNCTFYYRFRVREQLYAVLYMAEMKYLKGPTGKPHDKKERSSILRMNVEDAYLSIASYHTRKGNV